MTRQKKTRKERQLLPKKPKADKNANFADAKKPKKKVGNKAGSRQHLATEQDKSNAQTAKKDPRVGSKAPITLTKAPVSKPETKPKRNQAKIAPIHVVETELNEELSIAEQIDKIEQDSRLQEIIGKQELAQELTVEEIDYFNDLMEQHQVLSEQLESSDEGSTGEVSEDELWDKFDSSDLSEYQ